MSILTIDYKMHIWSIIHMALLSEWSEIKFVMIKPTFRINGITVNNNELIIELELIYGGT